MTAPLDNDAQNNPLLKPSTLPHGAPPLEGLKNEYFLPAINTAIAEARKEVDGIKFLNALPTFENTIEALELSGQALGRVGAVFGTIAGANTNKEIQKKGGIESQIDEALTEYSNDIMMDDKLFERVKAVYDARATLTLNPEQKMLLEKTYKGFVRSGALLDAAGKQEMREINKELSQLCTDFGNNTTASTESYQKVIDNEADLAGLPDRAKNDYKAAAEEEGLKGKWLIRLSPPPLDILEYCENRALREEIHRARMSVGDKERDKGAFDNGPLVLKIVKLRHRSAELLGFESHAAYVLDERMAKKPKTVMDFLNKNAAVYRPAAEKFLQEVTEFARKTDGLTALKPWDTLFYMRKLKEDTFKLDLEELRPYFDLEKVLDGVRIHAEKLFDISMTETKGKYPVYHPDVKVYEVKDNKSGEMIGLFYGDFYARPGAKRNGAWMGTLRDRGLEGGENKFALVTNTCNFAKPTKNQPTLLSLDDVRTVFHEFGHGLHALLAKGNYASLTGTSVKWDFVELPSQLQENWAKEKEVLDTFAVHYKTGKPLSAELIKKINDMENFDAAYGGMRQTFQGMLDMKWHTTDPATIKSVEAFEDSVIAKDWLFPREGAGTLSTMFGHLFSSPTGYSAGYYSYKWAEVLDADMFEPFKEKGLYDRKTADLTRIVYENGGIIDPAELYRMARGRDPDPDALFRREGLLPDNKGSKAASAPKGPRP